MKARIARMGKRVVAVAPGGKIIAKGPTKIDVKRQLIRRSR